MTRQKDPKPRQKELLETDKEFINALCRAIRRGDAREVHHVLGEKYESLVKERMQEGLSTTIVYLDSSRDFQHALPLFAVFDALVHQNTTSEPSRSEVDQEKLISLLAPLLENGFFVNRRNACGETALLRAVRMDLPIVVDYLIQAGADPSIRDLGNVSVLMEACLCKNSMLAKNLLLTSDLDTNAPDNEGNTTLHYACRGGHIDIVKMLLSSPKVSVNAVNNNLETPLFVAAENGDLRIVEALIQGGGNPAHVDSQGRTPIVAASSRNHEVVASVLKGALHYQIYAKKAESDRMKCDESNLIMRKLDDMENIQRMFQDFLLSALASGALSSSGSSQAPGSHDTNQLNKVVSHTPLSNDETVERKESQHSRQASNKKILDAEHSEVSEKLPPQKDSISMLKPRISQHASTISSSPTARITAGDIISHPSPKEGQPMPSKQLLIGSGSTIESNDAGKKETSEENEYESSNDPEEVEDEEEEAAAIWDEMIEDIEGIETAVRIREYYERVGMIPPEFM